jgi:hypothetical protein
MPSARDTSWGYGISMVLPDGSVCSVSWPVGRGTSFYSTSSADEMAALRGADVLWMSDQPRWVARAATVSLGGPRG